jgi:hypothetical protein
VVVVVVETTRLAEQLAKRAKDEHKVAAVVANDTNVLAPELSPARVSSLDGVRLLCTTPKRLGSLAGLLRSLSDGGLVRAVIIDGAASHLEGPNGEQSEAMLMEVAKLKTELRGTPVVAISPIWQKSRHHRLMNKLELPAQTAYICMDPIHDVKHIALHVHHRRKALPDFAAQIRELVQAAFGGASFPDAKALVFCDANERGELFRALDR